MRLKFVTWPVEIQLIMCVVKGCNLARRDSTNNVLLKFVTWPVEIPLIMCAVKGCNLARRDSTDNVCG